MARKDYLTTTLSQTDDDVKRIARLKKLLKMPMNKIVSLSLQMLEQLIVAQRKGQAVMIDQKQVMFMIPVEIEFIESPK